LMDAAPKPAPRSAPRRAIRAALILLAFAAVFGWVLPRFIDYAEVWDALSQLDAWEVVILCALGLARVPTEALVYRAFLPGLPLRRGSEAYLSSNFAGQLLPPPGASLIQYRYFRGGGYAADDAGLAALGSFVFPTVGRFLLPLVALVVLLLTRQLNGTVLLAGALAVAITTLCGIAGYFFLRAEDTARRIGAKVQRPLSWILVKLKRDRIEDCAGQAAALRLNALAVLREGWRLGTIGVAANLSVTYLILLAALRFVGVSSFELSASEAFAAFAIAFWAGAVVPITGSGLGIVDGVLIALLIEFGGADDDVLVAAALLWRVFYSILTLPLGAVTFSRFRNANADVLAHGTPDAPLA
jgi:uncharacterized membrane protein YbhN (UPF0104 family)